MVATVHDPKVGPVHLKRSSPIPYIIYESDIHAESDIRAPPTERPDCWRVHISGYVVFIYCRVHRDSIAIGCLLLGRHDRSVWIVCVFVFSLHDWVVILIVCFRCA